MNIKIKRIVVYGGKGVLIAVTETCRKSYLPGTGVNRDHEGSSPEARLTIALKVALTLAITPNVGNSSA